MTHERITFFGLVAVVFLGCNRGGDGLVDAGASGGGGGSGTLTVTGKLMTNTGAVVKNTPVGIGGKWTTSDDSGAFTIADVTTPYDLVSVMSSPSKIGVVFKGLTRADPTILFLGTIDSNLSRGTVTGALFGGDPLPETGDETIVTLGSAYHRVTATPFSLNLDWAGSTVFTGTLRALQFVKGPSGTPSAYRGYGERASVSVVHSSTVTGQDVVMTGVSTANLSGTVALPAGYALDLRTVSARFSDGAVFGLGADTALGGAFNVLTPSSIGATFSVFLEANGPEDSLSYVSANGLAANASGVTLTVQAAPVMALPVANGTGITTATDFTWTRFAGGVHVMAITPNGGSTNPQFYVFTSDTSARIPDLAAQGMGLPAGADYRWNVMGLAPFSSVDAFAARETGELFAHDLAWGTGTITYGNALNSRAFTTQ